MSFGYRVAAKRTSMLAAGVLVVGVLSAWTPASASSSKVLLVGSFDGKAGPYHTIQAAVDAAQPGDWILVGPGDYHEVADETGHPINPGEGNMGGVMIDKSGITLRGMDRNSVIVDGTYPGSSPCSSNPADQNYGRTGHNGSPVGRNGILVWKADDVSVENLTVCNFLAGTGASGNQVWWNGGDGSGRIGLTGYWGSYLTATSTFYANETSAAEYGIFSSNSAGPASLVQLYANNMNDSGTYVGACQQQCNVVLDHLWMENSALGYSGTNSGGKIVIENSQFDNNMDGLDTNTAVSGDAPAPQNGDCPNGGISPITHTHSCWVVIDDYLHDNNNPYVPESGSAGSAPIGTGMTISGGRNDTVLDNTITNNGAWGILFIPYAQSDKPSNNQTCKGAGGHHLPPFGCVLDPEGDALLNNTFSHNGYFGNPSNSDYGQITLFGGEPQNCYRGNNAPDGSAPPDLAAKQQVCGVATKKGKSGGPLFGQVLCDTRLASCPPGANYPVPNGTVILQPVPMGLPTMPNPCAGVPANAWCPSGSSSSKGPVGFLPRRGGGARAARGGTGEEAFAGPVGELTVSGPRGT